MWRVRIAELSGATLNEEADRFVHELTTSINGFNLDCGNCLAENCEPRDPDVRLEKVQERARNFANEKAEEISELSIHDLLHNRAISNLLARKAGIKTDADLRKRSESDLLAIPGFGEGSLKKVKKAMAAREQQLKED